MSEKSPQKDPKRNLVDQEREARYSYVVLEANTCCYIVARYYLSPLRIVSSASMLWIPCPRCKVSALTKVNLLEVSPMM